LSLESVLLSVEDNKRYCAACFTNNYPTNVTGDAAVFEMQRSLFDREREPVGD
jgi:glutamine phosphoribosylpyrophosphate amidotransferase